MVNYGLIGSFVVNQEMKIETVRVTREVYDQMLRRSLFYLLGWCQRTVLLSGRYCALKDKICRGITLDYEFNQYLIAYYEAVGQRYSLVPIHNSRGKYGLHDITGSEIAVTHIDDTKCLLFVTVKDGKHIVPLLSLKDV